LSFCTRAALSAVVCAALVAESDAFGGRRTRISVPLPRRVYKPAKPRTERRPPKPQPREVPERTRSSGKGAWHDDLARGPKSAPRPSATNATLPASLAARIESSRRFGYRDGYERGYDAGDLRRQAREVTDARDECDYHAAPDVYVSSFGPQEAYEEGYRTGFEQGFSAGLADVEYANLELSRDASAGTGERPAEVPLVGERLHGWRPVARLNGYEAGLQRGRMDRLTGRFSTSLKSVPEYANAIDGWNETACAQSSFQALYRQYFLLGYNQGRTPDANGKAASDSATPPARPARARKTRRRG
jgi:hypothetical protein